MGFNNFSGPLAAIKFFFKIEIEYGKQESPSLGSLITKGVSIVFSFVTSHQVTTSILDYKVYVPSIA